MFGLFRRGVLTSAVLGALGLAGAWQGVQTVLGPDEPAVPFMPRMVVERIADRVARDLPAPGRPSRLALLDVAGDRGGVVRDALLQAVADQGRYQILEPPLLQRLWSEVRGADAAPVRPEAAAGLPERLGVDAVLAAELMDFIAGANEAVVTLDVRLVARGGQVLFAQRYQDRAAAGAWSVDYWRAQAADASVGWRVLIWVLIVLALPFVAWPLVRRVTALESNGANVSLLAGLTAVDVLAALALSGWWVPSVWTALAMAVGAVVAGAYNYAVATMVDRLNR